MNTQPNQHKWLLIIVGALFLLWGILGLMDQKNYTFDGYISASDYSVIEVTEGSPAALAGMQVGDVLKSVGGISVTDQKSLSKRERAKVGETREFVVSRNDEDLTLELTYVALPDKYNALNYVAFMIGLIFILLALFIYSKLGTDLSLSFAMFSMAFGLTFFSGPYIGPGIAYSVISSLFAALLMFSFVLLVLFMLKYPPRSSFLDDENSNKILFAPAILIVVIIIFLEFFHPDSTTTMNTVLRLIFGAIIIFYFAVAVYTLLRKYRQADNATRDSSGLNYLLWGGIIGLVPVLIYFIITTISQKTILPGNEYIFVTFVAIPIFFSLALIKLNKASV